MAFLYIMTCILIFALSLAPSLEEVMNYAYNLAHIPVGFRTLAVALLLIVFLFIILMKRKAPVIKDIFRVFVLWIPWIVYLGIRTNLTDIGIWKYEAYILKVLVPCLATATIYLANPELFRKYFMPTLLFVNLLLVVFSIIQAHAGNRLDFEQNIWLSRGLGINLVYFIINFKAVRMKILVIPLIPVLLAIMIYIGSRGPVLSVMLTLFIYSTIKFRKNIIMLTVLFMSGFIISLSFIYIDYLSASFQSFATHGHRVNVESAADNRLLVYKPTLKIFMEHPVVGVGLGKWWEHYKKENLFPSSWFALKFIRENKRDYTYPHNILLEVLSELGVFGLCFFLVLFYPYRRLFQIQDGYSLLLFLCFLYACSSSDLTINSPLMVFNTLGILAWRGAVSKKTPDPRVYA